MTKDKAAAFLQNMAHEPAVPLLGAGTVQAEQSKAESNAGRTGLKHIGGYFAVDTVEKVAILRARLNLDNSELLKRAIDDLYRKHSAKRAFGDA